MRFFRAHFLCRCLVWLTLLVTSAQAAETSIEGGASFNYKHDDNIRITPVNEITLSGITLDAYVDAAYSTERFSATTYLKLGIERYDTVDLDTDNPLLDEPSTSDFDNESQDFNTQLSYAWERHSLSVYGRYWRDSTLNTQFQDTGLGGLREIEGATDRATSTANATWQWQLTERQVLDTTLQWQTVDYESAFYIGYDYNSIVTNWSYVLNERLRLQVQPYFSRYQNESNTAITSDSLGLQVGAIWGVTERWQLDALVGSTLVSTQRSGEVPIFNPETGQVEFVELEDQDSTNFSGNITLGFDEQYYGFSANLSASISPSGDGVLRQNSEARLKYYWKPRERVRLDINARVGRSETTGDRVDDERDYSQAGIRLGYQFAQDWWFLTSYRYRVQEYERNGQGEGNGNSISASVSYRLPREVL
jgi:hypothetical protein